ncbi:hypothetical protein J6590_022953 [Homalodisca vitripennis]|nr:hypothetical protein J6590_022953 [Homalodisca vitripennis]
MLDPLVRQLLEYGSDIWFPYQLGHIDELNGVQARFVSMLGVRLGFTYLETPLPQLEQLLSLQHLHHRRVIFNMIFLFKLIIGLVGLPSSGIDLKGTRSRSVSVGDSPLHPIHTTLEWQCFALESW